MSETPLPPERFAWLMSLPADHPERIAWRGRPEFEAARALYDQFEAQPGVDFDRDVRQAEIDLERRFRETLEQVPRRDAPRERPPAGQRRAGRSWWRVVQRPALAMAAVVIVAIGGGWLATRPRSAALRGATDAPVILEPRRVAEDLEIRWTPVAGAESYRLSFFDESMREVAAVEDCVGTLYLLESSALPPGLEHGARMILQVRSVRVGADAGAAGTRSIRVP